MQVLLKRSITISLQLEQEVKRNFSELKLHLVIILANVLDANLNKHQQQMMKFVHSSVPNKQGVLIRWGSEGGGGWKLENTAKWIRRGSRNKRGLHFCLFWSKWLNQQKTFICTLQEQQKCFTAKLNNFCSTNLCIQYDYKKCHYGRNLPLDQFYFQIIMHFVFLTMFFICNVYL